jgi:hypothetical protein
MAGKTVAIQQIQNEFEQGENTGTTDLINRRL